MRFNRLITLVKTTEDYSTGDLVVTTSEQKTFKGAVKEKKDVADASGATSFRQIGDRLRAHRLIEITCYSKSLSNIVVGDQVRISGTDDLFTITDIYELLHDRYSVLIVEHRT